MSEFEGEAEVGFGFLGFLSHLFISLSVLLVIFALVGHFINAENTLFGYLLGAGGAGVGAGIVLGFLNVLTN